MNYKDIEELLNGVENDIKEVEESSKIQKPNRRAIKHALEDLRSCLEYSATAISKNLQSPDSPRIIYFPYSKERKDFESRADKMFPNIQDNMPDVFSSIEDLQPFKCHSYWLTHLCNLTNKVKHTELGDYETAKEVTVFQEGVPVVTSMNSDVYLSGNTVNGVKQGTVFIDNKGNVDVISSIRNIGITSNNVILFEGERIDAVRFLREAHAKIKYFVEKIKTYLQ